MTQKPKAKLLLRRLGHNLRDQDWFTVAVEFFIVVFGVFLGIQVANWNEERLQRDDERAILVRLQDETENLLNTVRAEGKELQLQADRLVSAQPVLFSAEPERPLTPGECLAIVASHVYRKPSDELPILEELLATGRFDRLQNADLKQELRRYIMFRDRERGNHEERTNELFRLHSLYPDLITIDLIARGDEDEPLSRFELLSADAYQWNRRCDSKGMRSNQPFLNDLFDNMARNGNVLNSNRMRETLLVELQEHLNHLLNP
ncbi:hypothetical protein [Altererythrobacter ishigakiensis]|uniref:Uncharacterized protein n=1 Tax=Altererythrobacter ishigakiensis TaxID=476157 RepID=A0A562UVG3_9SPHN|nr:hypothetical protein [Altererythrobacter ishigakiensis]TWJ09609.1 hypothetical protein JN10_1247 [Altererythrobacter ishigakiensis]